MKLCLIRMNFLNLAELKFPDTVGCNLEYIELFQLLFLVRGYFLLTEFFLHIISCLQEMLLTRKCLFCNVQHFE